jgi:hypothetical protein
VWQQLLRDDVCERLLNDLRKQGSAGAPPVWSLLIDVAPDEAQVLTWSREGSPFAAAAHALCRPSEIAVTSESAAIVDTRRGVREPHFGSRVRQRAVRTAARRLPGLKTEVLPPH